MDAQNTPLNDDPIHGQAIDAWSGIDWRLRLERYFQQGVESPVATLFFDWQAWLGLAPWQMEESDLFAFLKLHDIPCAEGIASVFRGERQPGHNYPRHQKLVIERIPKRHRKAFLRHLDEQITVRPSAHPLRLARIIQQEECELMMMELQHFFKAPPQLIQCCLGEAWGFPALLFYQQNPAGEGCLHQVWLSPYNSVKRPEEAACSLSSDYWCRQYLQDQQRLLDLRLHLCIHLEQIEDILGIAVDAEQMDRFAWLSSMVRNAPFHALHMIAHTQHYWEQMLKAEQVTDRALEGQSLRFVPSRISSAIADMVYLLQQGRLTARKIEAARKALQMLEAALHCDLASGDPEVAVNLLFPHLSSFGLLMSVLNEMPMLLTGMNLTAEDVGSMHRLYERIRAERQGSSVSCVTPSM
ncbi:MAG: hypothetical protein IBX50_08170 [Marinospirillum sp.]|uniref:hypothetical protein n=1 Tax=Marinospirillum sp. TaxID=2183934 RepID=UPI0019FC74BE|nr:hypothetical protein [Marinospirillum sp.]MBE0506681.1 hypothetical protein [Marinospirillum sp.]